MAGSSRNAASTPYVWTPGRPNTTRTPSRNRDLTSASPPVIRAMTVSLLLGENLEDRAFSRAPAAGVHRREYHQPDGRGHRAGSARVALGAVAAGHPTYNPPTAHAVHGHGSSWLASARARRANARGGRAPRARSAEPDPVPAGRGGAARAAPAAAGRLAGRRGARVAHRAAP